MRSLAIAIALVSAAFASAGVYQVHNRRPSVILASLLGSSDRSARIYQITGGSAQLVPKGVSLMADDTASTITIDGSKELVDQMSLLLETFDVSVRKVSTRIEIHSKADKYDSVTQTEVGNASAFSLEDQSTGLSLQVAPRINQDGTVTATLCIKTQTGSVKVVSRVKQGEQVRFGGSRGSVDSLDIKAAESHQLLDILDGLEINITFDLKKDSPAVQTK